VCAHKPAFHIDDGTEEFVCEKGAAVRLLEIDSIGGEDSCEICAAGVMEKGQASHVNGAKNFSASVMAGFPREEILFRRNGVPIYWVKECIARASVG
jgi:hypothetical protein